MSPRTIQRRPPFPGVVWEREPRHPRAGVTLSRLLGLFALLGMVWATIIVPLLQGFRETPDGLRPPPAPPRPAMPDPALEPAEPGTTPAILQDNPLYLAGALPVVECPAPPLADAGAEAQRGYHEELLGCLIEAWRELLGRVGLPEGRPRVFVFTEAGTSPCGSFQPATGRMLAFYCPANETIYVDAGQLADAFPPDHDIAYGILLAHEFGHHTQHMAGILEAQARLSYESPADAPELSRRTETQASCFAGMSFRSIELSYPVEGEQRERFELWAYNTIGDSRADAEHERTHGTPETQGTWILRGFTLNDTGECNTFIVPASEVQ